MGIDGVQNILIKKLIASESYQVLRFSFSFLGQITIPNKCPYQFAYLFIQVNIINIVICHSIKTD